MAQITITFSVPTPAPTSYIYGYREVGALNYTEGTHTGSGALVISGLANGKSWEGYIKSRCGFKDESAPVMWGPVSTPVPPASGNWSFTETGGEAGSMTITVNGTQVVNSNQTQSASINFDDGDAVSVMVIGFGGATQKLHVLKDGITLTLQEQASGSISYDFTAVGGSAYTIEAEVL